MSLLSFTKTVVAGQMLGVLFLLLVSFSVPVDVDSAHVIVGKHLHEVFLKFLAGQLLENITFPFLAIEQVLVS